MTPAESFKDFLGTMLGNPAWGDWTPEMVISTVRRALAFYERSTEIYCVEHDCQFRTPFQADCKPGCRFETGKSSYEKSSDDIRDA